MRYYKQKRDAVEQEIVSALRSAGFYVHLMDEPCDALAARDGAMYLHEYKAAKGTLTPKQVAFAEKWPGPAVVILRTVEQAIEWANSQRRSG